MIVSLITKDDVGDFGLKNKTKGDFGCLKASLGACITLVMAAAVTTRRGFLKSSPAIARTTLECWNFAESNLLRLSPHGAQCKLVNFSKTVIISSVPTHNCVKCTVGAVYRFLHAGGGQQ